MTDRVLLVEDDFALRLGLTTTLRGHGLTVEAVASAEEAREAIRGAAPVLVVLDWSLPGQSGLELLESWRAAGLRWPVILLTARDAVADRVRGLNAGADDYLVKPFATEELVARIHVQLRQRATSARSGMLVLSGASVDLARGTVIRPGGTQVLTSQEVAALTYLAARPGKTIARDELLRDVWGHRGGVVTRAVDNTILRLRAKVEVDPGAPRHILTVHGVGYRFEP